MPSWPKAITATLAVALVSLALPARSTRADEREDMTRLLAELRRAGEIDTRSDSFDLEPFKQIELPNRFGFPGYANLRVPVYRSAGTRGPGVLLVHGNSSSARSYARQVFGLLGNTLRLYLIDLPGFGQSQKVDPDLAVPTAPGGIPIGFPEYQLGLVEAVAEVAADPELAPKVFVGWSLGGSVVLAARGFGLLPDAQGFLIFGTAPQGAMPPSAEVPGLPPFVPGFPGVSQLNAFGLGVQPDATSPLGFNANLSFDDPVPDFAPFPISAAPSVGDAYVRAFFRPLVRLLGLVPPFFLEDAVDRADPRARTSLAALALAPPGTFFPDDFETLRGLAGDPDDPDDDIPIAVLIGQREAFLNRAYLFDLADAGAIPTLWRSRIIEVPGAGHAVHFDQPLLFNLLLVDLIRDVSR